VEKRCSSDLQKGDLGRRGEKGAETKEVAYGNDANLHLLGDGVNNGRVQRHGGFRRVSKRDYLNTFYPIERCLSHCLESGE